MSLKNRIAQFFLKPTVEELNGYFNSLESEVVYRKLALNMCVDLISNAMLKVEYRTYEGNKFKKNNMYYRLNVAPNVKENASEFYKKLLYKLYFDNEVLIVSPYRKDTQMFIADDYSRTEMALKPDVFEQVQINGMTLRKSFKETDVLFLKLTEGDMTSIVNSYFSSYGKLLSSAINTYKRSNASRYVFKGDVIRPQSDDIQSKINKMMTSQFKEFMEADNAGAVFQIQDGFDLVDFSSNSQTNSRDIKAVFDDIFSTTASAFHVPQGLWRGDVSGLSDQLDAFLMFTIHPLVQLLVNEINSKLYDEASYLKGSRVKADTSNIKVTDITSMANALDKLFAIGGISINGINEKIGGDPIDEDWADKRYITKNYGQADEDKTKTQNLKGGEKSSEETKSIHI